MTPPRPPRAGYAISKCAPPPPVDPPLVKGGQGRDESSMERSARIFAWVLVFLTIGAALLYAAAKVGMVPWGAR